MYIQENNYTKKSTHVGGLTILNSSTGDVGTLLTIIFFPSVEPMPTDAHDRTDPASENGFALILIP